MDILALDLALAVARAGSFAAVARQRDMDPSAVSRGIAALEAELGLRLFQRSTRQLSVTEEGALYLERVEPLLDGLEAARDAALGPERRPSGHVRVTASVAFGQMCIVPLLPRFAVALPEVTLELILTDEVVDLVAGGADLAIRLAPAPEGDLISTRLRPTRYHVCAAPTYLARAGRPDTPAALSDHPCLRQTLPAYRHRWRFRDGAGQVTQVPVSGPVLISSPLGLAQGARDGLGPALLADWLVAGDLAAGTLVDLFPDLAVTATDFDTGAWALYPSRRYLPPRVRAVLDLLRSGLRMDAQGGRLVARETPR